MEQPKGVEKECPPDPRYKVFAVWVSVGVNIFQPQGMGVLVYPDGQMRTARWTIDVETNEGTRVLENGNIYKGPMVVGLRHGKGQPDAFGKIVGRGTNTTEESVYIGDWDYEKRHGKGMDQFALFCFLLFFVFMGDNERSIPHTSPFSD